MPYAFVIADDDAIGQCFYAQALSARLERVLYLSYLAPTMLRCTTSGAGAPVAPKVFRTR